MREYLPLILEGAFTTIQIAIASLLLAVAFGLIYIRCYFSKKKLLSNLAKTYRSLMRGVPSLVMMYLIYYGVQALLNELLLLASSEGRVIINSFIAGIFTLALIYGAYMGETFRAAILAMGKGTIEAAQALGLNRRQVFLKIMFPQMVKHGFASFENNWLVLLKDTSIISIIGIADLVFIGKGVGRSVQQPFTILFIVSLIYLLLNIFSHWGFNYFRSKYRFD